MAPAHVLFREGGQRVCLVSEAGVRQLGDLALPDTACDDSPSESGELRTAG